MKVSLSHFYSLEEKYVMSTSPLHAPPPPFPVSLPLPCPSLSLLPPSLTSMSPPPRLSQCPLWMDVCRSVMGPERVLPNSEDELGEDERPADGALLPVWSGGEEEEEGGEMELDGEEEENSGGYYYQPLNQEPEQPGEDGGEEGPSHTEQLQQVQHRIEVSSHCFSPEQRLMTRSWSCNSAFILSLTHVSCR